MKIVIIDNYDSFTYNLSHLVKELGADVTVYRNDQFQMEQLEEFDKIILSPGPGIPCEAGLLLDVIKAYAGKKPILGVCLGHQAIGESFGGKLTNLSEVYHGVATPTTITVQDYLFEGLPTKIEVGRYHSWGGGTQGLPDQRFRRRLHHVAAPQAVRHPRHPVPPRKRTDQKQKNNHQ